jgi:hypothetical protein
MISNSREEQEPKVVIGWSSTIKPPVYDVETYNLMKKKKTGAEAGTGYLIFNPVSNRHESPRSIDILPPARKKKQQQPL